MEDLCDLFTYNVNEGMRFMKRWIVFDVELVIQLIPYKNGMLENRVEVDCIESNCEGYQSSQNTDDIGGFAEISGLHILKNSQKQVGSPSEEDLLNWAHHSSPTSVPDILFQAAASD